MTTDTDLGALIARVEGASEGSRELSCAVAHAIGWRPEEGCPGWNTSSPWAWCPDFTEIIDAAMSLVPKGYHTPFASQDRHSLRWKWELRGGYGFRYSARAATPALALVAAALRARVGVGETGGAA